MKNWWLYVLELEQGKWYVGITSKTPEIRFREHLNGRGANWTRKYKPLKIHYTEHHGHRSENSVKLRENRVSREYIKKYGINNVRGGDLTDTKPMIKRFGWFWDKEGWGNFLYVVFATFAILFLLIKLYV